MTSTTSLIVFGNDKKGVKLRNRAKRRDPFESALGLGGIPGIWGKVVRFVIYAVVLFIFAGPIYILLVNAFSAVPSPANVSLIPTNFTFDNFAGALNRNVFTYLGNSFIVVGFGLVLQILVSVSAAYALSRKKFPGMQLIMLLILSTMMLPEEILAIPLSLVLADVPIIHVNLIGSLVGMIVPVGAWGFSILVMTEFMKEVPIELEEAARIDGAGELRTFWNVILPLTRPGLGVITIFGFNMIWDQYMLPLLVATDSAQYTLPLALRSLRSDETLGIGVVLAGAVLALLPSLIIFLCMQKQFMAGLNSGAVKG